MVLIKIEEQMLHNKMVAEAIIEESELILEFLKLEDGNDITALKANLISIVSTHTGDNVKEPSVYLANYASVVKFSNRVFDRLVAKKVLTADTDQGKVDLRGIMMFINYMNPAMLSFLTTQ